MIKKRDIDAIHHKRHLWRLPKRFIRGLFLAGVKKKAPQALNDLGEEKK